MIQYAAWKTFRVNVWYLCFSFLVVFVAGLALPLELKLTRLESTRLNDFALSLQLQIVLILLLHWNLLPFSVLCCTFKSFLWHPKCKNPIESSIVRISTAQTPQCAFILSKSQHVPSVEIWHFFSVFAIVYICSLWAYFVWWIKTTFFRC